jgi:predicted acyl esterase
LVASILASINKKDMDIVIDLYEQLPDGRYLALNENVQRVSYVKDHNQRQLLKPGNVERISIENNFITSIRLEKGSRIIILLGINKSNQWQINYGTGKDVSDETIKDAGVPMEIKWYNDSYIQLPILR